MYSTSNRKQPCRFFLQKKCNRGNNCKWSHDLAGDINYSDTNFSTAPPTGNLAPGHGVYRSQSTDGGAGVGSVTTGEALLARPPFLPRPPQVPGRETGNRGGGSRGRGNRGRPTTKEKGKGPAHTGVQRNEDNYSDIGAPSAATYQPGNRGTFGDVRGRRGGTRGGFTGIRNNTEDVDTTKKWPWNVNNSQPATLPLEPTTNIRELSTTLEKILAGSMSVRIGPGFSIQSITPITVSSSSIVIENVPAGTPMDALQALVEPFKPSISPHAIRITPRGNSLRVIAHFDDTVAADEAVRALESAEFRGRALAVKALKPTGASEDVTKIECSWFPASVTAVLLMQTKEQAQELIRSCGTGPKGVPKIIRGRRVRAILQVERPRWGTLFPAVSLLNLDPMTAEEDIRVHFDDGIMCIELQQPKYQMSDFLTLRYIRRRFMVDSEEDLRVISGPSDARTRAIMTYASAADAIAAFTKVQGENDEMFTKMNFTYNLTYSASFHIPCDIWKVVKEEIRRLMVTEQERKQQTRGVVGGSNVKLNPGDGDEPARIKILDGRGGTAPILVHVNGGGRSAVARIKVAIQKLLRGRIICDEEGKPLWDPALRGPEGRRLVQLVTESDVHVHVDYRNRTVTMYGSPAIVDAGETILKEQYRLLLTMQHELSLGGHHSRMAFRGGIAAVKEHLGEDMVIVNHAARKIFVRCSPADVGQVRNLLYNPHPTSEGPWRPDSTSAKEEDDCPVCMEPAEPPLVKTSCGHTYCKTCITGFIKATINGRKFPISCFHSSGDGTTACDTPLSISIIQDVLSKADSDQLLEISFSVHVQARPNEYAYCPTPDCPTVYVVTPTGALFTCNQCLLGICTACKTAAHHGQTCAQYKTAIDIAAAGESQFQEWKRRAGVKSCPKCNADIEKNDGCNHMTCKCGAHLCWHCMKEFTAGTIYQHMRTECGGTWTQEVAPGNPAPPPVRHITPPLPPDPVRVFAARTRATLEQEQQRRTLGDVQRLRELQAQQQERERALLQRQQEIERQRRQIRREWEEAQAVQRVRRREAEEEEMRRRQEAAAKSKGGGFCVVM